MAKAPGAHNCTIAPAKITHYLLVPRVISDKSKFFLGDGFTRHNWRVLDTALRRHVQTHDYVSVRPICDETDPTIIVGHNYTVICALQTPDGRNPCMRTIWAVIGSVPPKTRHRRRLTVAGRFHRTACSLSKFR